MTAEDRWLILQLIRGPGRVAALDGPPYDQSREFVPSTATENALAAQFKLAKSLGKKGREIIRDVDAYTAGINANFAKNHPGIKPWTRNDTIAAAAVLAGQYGVGGGDEARRAELLAELQAELGATQGREVWNDLREQQDPETPPTATRSFPYGREHERGRQRDARRGQPRQVGRAGRRGTGGGAREHEQRDARHREALDHAPPDLRGRPAGRLLLPRPSSSSSTCTAAASTPAAPSSRAFPGS